MLEFLVGGCGGNEETFLVTGNVLEYSPVALVECDMMPQSRDTYPAVSLPTILVPAMVAWQMGMTSWSSASKTLSRHCQYIFFAVYARHGRITCYRTTSSREQLLSYAHL
ncbi:eukaryotic translation initiation factor 6 [Alternaria alternata]|nr:eukaryotic translation initiation factor 6 [Alternaria alternata]